MAASHLSSPAWHVAAALVVSVAAALAGHDGAASAAPRTPSGAVSHVDAAAETDRLRTAAGHQVDIVEATHLDGGTRALFPIRRRLRMASVPRTSTVRVTRRGALAGTAAGALAVAAWPRASSAVSVGDAALAGPLGDVWLGSPQAKVALIEYAAVTCPHCAAFHNEAWPAIRARWIDSGQVRFALRGYPLNPFDTAGFMLARADGARNYYAVTDLLFEKQAAWAFVPKPLDAMRELVLQAGIGRERFDAILRDQALYDGVRQVHAQATSVLGVHSTPTLFVNDARQEGAMSADALGEIMERALQKRPG